MVLLILILCINITLKAQTQPEPPTIIKVTVDTSASSKATIFWIPSITPNVAGYYIFKKSSGQWYPIDTVRNPYAVSYQYPASEAGRNYEEYEVAAYDSNNFVSSMTMSGSKTMYVFPFFVRCPTPTIRLECTPYGGWAGILKYNIYYKITVNDEQAPFQLLKSEPGTAAINNDGKISFQIPNVDFKTRYCFYIEAIKDDSTVSSNSNFTCILTDSLDRPSYVFAKDLKIFPDKSVELTFIVDSVHKSNGYKIYRSTSINGQYSVIKSYTGLTPNRIIYNDNVDASATKFYYKIAIIDKCNEEILSSPSICNIIVNYEFENMFSTKIEWNEVENWTGGVESYNVYRVLQGLNPTYLGNTNERWFYDDKLSEAINQAYSQNIVSSGELCYFVEAFEGNTNIFGHQAGKSNSANICKKCLPLIYIPNAFCPTSQNPVNRIFKPYVSFASSNYYFAIYDKFGSLIFETNDTYTGWDGKMGKNKKNAPQGVYAYLLVYKNEYGEEVKRAGSLTLIYNSK